MNSSQSDARKAALESSRGLLAKTLSSSGETTLLVLGVVGAQSAVESDFLHQEVCHPVLKGPDDFGLVVEEGADAHFSFRHFQ
jgi:hypothetical protein